MTKDFKYKGYWVRHNLINGTIWIEALYGETWGTVGYASSDNDARQQIDLIVD